MDFKMVDNKGQNTLINMLKAEIKGGSKVAIASAYFSLFAYYELKRELEKTGEFRFLYTKPTFYKKETELKRQYRISQNQEETAELPKFDGNHFEIQLRNKMISNHIAAKATKWIKERAQFKTIIGETQFPKELLVEQADGKESLSLQSEIEFTADGLGITESNRFASFPVVLNHAELISQSMKEFDQIWHDEEKVQDVTDEVLNQLKFIYKENSPEWLYFVTLYNIFSNVLESLDEEKIIKKGTNFKNTIIWNKLYAFQRDGVVGIIDKIEKHNGCILADSVGLGKTFSALAVIKYYELRNDRVLVLSPKKLRDNWTVYTQNDKRNVLIDDRFNYDVLNHTDLSREGGHSGEINLDMVNWSNYDLVVIDESHNFRNNNPRKDRLTRYQKLMQDIIKKGVKTKVLLLSATPVNNKMSDIKNQIAFITEDKDNTLNNDGIESIEHTLKMAQTVFNQWSELPTEKRTTENFLDMVDPDYFQLLDLLTIARSRKHIEKYYGIEEIGEFPQRLKPDNMKADIDNRKEFIEMDEVNERIESLTFGIYKPMNYILPAKRKHYEELYDTKVGRGSGVFKQTDRESAVASLMKVNIFKRLESSIHSFNKTLERLVRRLEETIDLLKKNNRTYSPGSYVTEDIEDMDDDAIEAITVGSEKIKIKLFDIDHVKWLDDLENDLSILTELLSRSSQIIASRDEKLDMLKGLIQKKIENPINHGNQKIIIFSAFADTAKYLYKQLADELKKSGLHTALVVGSGENKTTLKGIRTKDINDILVNFSPISKERDNIAEKLQEEIDIMIATDCISEGQNLQDCDYLINYDIHWNPVRVIQRFGRIDRIGSRNKYIKLVNFWPNMEIDEYINLEDRVKGRMKILSTSATGEEDILDISSKEMHDIEYRRNQLKHLQDEVVNLEDVSGAISITDLTYTEFKSDLSVALKENGNDLQKAPKGMYALATTKEFEDAKPGVIFCFLQTENFDMTNNSLAPYILLYLTEEGDVHLHFTNAKKILDYYRKLSLGVNKPFKNLVKQFNEETNDGEDMQRYTDLLQQSIDIVKDKQDSDAFESFFSPGGTSTSMQTDIQLDFDELELISFLIIKEET
ncbi:helicase-related protein [Lentibacillus sediminis]|uniref:helicase-related protein n=1 Tax=Lentibacillus sediminis TaxID=1940529 RepID=UPI000C1BEBE0|nr:helicase-related protein [Lentibacillus sediminis]